MEDEDNQAMQDAHCSLEVSVPAGSNCLSTIDFFRTSANSMLVAQEFIAR
jgi:hypothetical protein